MQEDLVFLYQVLRQQLNAAHAAPAWQGQRIDLITGDMLRLERQLALQNTDGLLPSDYLGKLPAGAEGAEGAEGAAGAAAAAPPCSLFPTAGRVLC